VAEETGIAVTNVRYQGSESWPFPHQLMLGYVADFAGGDLQRAEDELAALDWFHRDSLPRVPGDWTIAGRLIGLVAGGTRMPESRPRILLFDSGMGAEYCPLAVA